MGLGLVLLSFSSVSAQITTSPTYPDISTFLWGNTSVNAVGQTAFVSGTGYGYRYILPKNFDPTVKYPTILYLHGKDECGSDDNAQLAAGNNTAHGALALVSTANPDNQTNFPCFFIAPQLPANAHWDDAGATEIQNLFTIFETQYPNSFDTSRIYITGNSRGGVGTYDLPYLLAQSTHLGANPFAAAAPLSGEIGYYDGRQPSTEPNLPIWAFHGAMDTTIPIAAADDTDVPALRAMGFSVIYSRYTTGQHDIWELAYQHPQLLPWMFSQKLGQPQQPLSNFVITGATQPSGSTLGLSGTATTSALPFNGLSWSDTVSGQSGSASGALFPAWNIPSIPIITSSDLIQVTATAPNNTALVYGVATDYGGTMTVNLPYVASTASPITNVALNKTVTVSSVDGTADAGKYAVDGNTTTRWSSAYSDPQWIVVDLGNYYDISEITLNWEVACGKNYLIQTSNDNVNWTTQTTVTGNTATGFLAYTYATPPTARYVRVYGTARATKWGYSLYELAVYGELSTSPPPPPPPTLTNVALNKTVTVSSVDSTAHAGKFAVDGDATTRWSSAFSDPQWIVVDLGNYYDISEITLNWEVACGQNYLIQTSNDDVSWTTQTTVTGNTTTGLLAYSYAAPPSARYVRVYGTARATIWGYSLYELAVYGVPSTTTPPTGPTLTNLALNMPVTVSSTDGNPGPNAVDGNITTRWSSKYSDNQWIVVDLGANHTITEVDLNWEGACGKNYQIQTSPDNSTWTTQTTVTGNTKSGVLAYPYGTPITARYVRMLGTARATAYGYSLWEFDVYGQ